MSATATRPTATRDLVLTRILNAPTDLVYRLWTEPKHMAQWWGPHGFTNPVCDMDVRPGGALRIDMTGPDGTAYPMVGTFQEVVPGKRLVFMAIAQDAEGNPLLESLTTVTFEDLGGKTKLTVDARAVGISPLAPQMLAGMEAGWTQSLERLEALTAKQ
jgi:uncharacterized protein YndB with AHSA1/START domain